MSFALTWRVCAQSERTIAPLAALRRHRARSAVSFPPPRTAVGRLAIVRRRAAQVHKTRQKRPFFLTLTYRRSTLSVPSLGDAEGAAGIWPSFVSLQQLRMHGRRSRPAALRTLPLLDWFTLNTKLPTPDAAMIHYGTLDNPRGLRSVMTGDRRDGVGTVLVDPGLDRIGRLRASGPRRTIYGTTAFEMLAGDPPRADEYLSRRWS